MHNSHKLDTTQMSMSGRIWINKLWCIYTREENSVIFKTNTCNRIGISKIQCWMKAGPMYGPVYMMFETFWRIEKHCVLIQGLVITWVYEFTQTRWVVHFRSLHFALCEFCLKLKKKNKKQNTWPPCRFTQTLCSLTGLQAACSVPPAQNMCGWRGEVCFFPIFKNVYMSFKTLPQKSFTGMSFPSVLAEFCFPLES